MSNTMNAAANPAMANKMLQDALATSEPVKDYEVKLAVPLETVITLPGGLIDEVTGEVITEAEVRELNGTDEEAIARVNTVGKAILTILQRGTVRIGRQKADEQLLDKLLAGDREMLIFSILKATFGNTSVIDSFCRGCSEVKEVSVDLNIDVKMKVLADRVNDRVFTVQGKSKVYTCQLPTGRTQKELILATDKNRAEMTTTLLEGCVIKVDDSPVFGKFQVQTLPLADRRTIADEINSRLIGPQFKDITAVCPDCDGEVQVPINFGTLFRI